MTPEWDADDGYSPEDNSAAELLPCPSCRRLVYEESEQCPHCGEWIMPRAARSGLPGWVRGVALIVAVAMAALMLGGLLRWRG